MYNKRNGSDSLLWQGQKHIINLAGENIEELLGM
jgi:hypothetical protein